MSVTGPAQSAVDWVNPVNWGPWGPLAVTQGVAPGVPRRRPAPEQRRRPDARRRGSGVVRVSRTGGLRRRGWARSTRLDVARPTAVVGGAGTAGVDRYELAGGEVLRVPDGSYARARERPN